MFDLDREVLRLLRRLTKKSLVDRDGADEIESHVREEIDDLLAAGYEAAEAFAKAAAAFGEGDEFLGEYEKIYGNSRVAQWRNVLSYYFDRRVMMRVFIGILVALFFMLGGLLLEGGQLSSVFQLTSVFIVVGGAFGALLIAYPAKTVFKSFILALTGRQALRAAYLDAAKVFSSFGDLAIMTGFVGVLFGSIHVLEHLDRMDVVGPGVAVGFVSPLYGLFVKIFIGRPLYDSFMFRAYPSAEAVSGSHDDDRDHLQSA
jgi:hypothetical protein